MTLNKTLGYALVTTSLVTLTACGGGSSSSSTASPKPVTIPFVAKSGDTEITCDAELLELGTTADSAKIASFAYYVYDVELSFVDSSSNTIIERILEGKISVSPSVTR